jgi:hypothetical protein
VIVAVAVVHVVAVPIDDVIDVIVVLDLGMTARRAVNVLRIMAFAGVGGARGAHAS